MTRSLPCGREAWWAYLMEYPVTSFVQMYPTVGALLRAAVKAAMGVGGAPASPRPRATPPRPPRPAPPRRPRAAASPPPAAPAGAVDGAAGFIAATTGLRSSSVD